MIGSRAVIATTALASVLVASPCLAQQFNSGVPTAAMAAISKSLPRPARIASIQLFNDFQKSASSIAVLTSTKVGWSIYIFAPFAGSAYRDIWNSGPLPHTFDVASPLIRVEQVNERDAVAFNGCVAHMCPDIFSSFLYVPSLHRAYIGTCRDGTTEFSFQSSTVDKDVLRYLRQDLHSSDLSGTACGPDTREISDRNNQ